MNIAGSTTLIINGNKYEAPENVEQTKQASEYGSDRKEKGISLTRWANNTSMLALSTVSVEKLLCD